MYTASNISTPFLIMIALTTAAFAQNERKPDAAIGGQLKSAVPRGAGSVGAAVPNLTEAECTGLGGKVVTTQASSCPTAKGCITVNKDGVENSLCIDNKKN